MNQSFFFMQKIMKKINRDKVFEKYKGKCSYCGVSLKFKNMQVDHIVPIHRGISDDCLNQIGIIRGLDNISNYNPSCASCNTSKGSFQLENWRKDIILKVLRLEKITNFRLLKRFGLIDFKKNDVVFYFEKFEFERLSNTF